MVVALLASVCAGRERWLAVAEAGRLGEQYDRRVRRAYGRRG